MINLIQQNIYIDLRPLLLGPLQTVSSLRPLLFSRNETSYLLHPYRHFFPKMTSPTFPCSDSSIHLYVPVGRHYDSEYLGRLCLPTRCFIARKFTPPQYSQPYIHDFVRSVMSGRTILTIDTLRTSGISVLLNLLPTSPNFAQPNFRFPLHAGD